VVNKTRDEPRKPKPKAPVRLIAYDEFQQELVWVRHKVDKAWSPAIEAELNKRLETISRLINGNPGPNTLLSREATGAVRVLKKWANRLKS